MNRSLMTCLSLLARFQRTFPGCCNPARPSRALFIPLVVVLILSHTSFAQPALPLSSRIDNEPSMMQRLSTGYEKRRSRGMHAGSATVPALDLLAPSAECSDRWREGTPVNGVGGAAYAIAVDGAGNVYVGGWFKAAGSSIVNNIAKWGGSSWSALGSGTNGEVTSIAISGTDIFIGGDFTTAGGVAANYVAKWNGSSWSPVGPGPGYPVYDLEMSGSTIYVGGGIWDPSTQTAEGHVSVWNGTSLSALGPSMSWHVTSIDVSGTDVYAGGGFSSVGGMPARQMIKWNGSGWTDIGTGFNAHFWDLAVSGTEVYAVGTRGIGNGVNEGYVAKWNGTNWSQVGAGFLNPGTGSYAIVYSICVSGTDLYVGGHFSTVGGIPADGVAKWNGTSWSPVGSWGGYVGAITVSGNDVYFGGWLSSSGGVWRSTGIAKWNGTDWSALGSGIYTVPRVLTVSGGDVYGAGYFTTDGGNTVSRAAKWNGSGWTPLGVWPAGPEGTVPTITAIAALGSDVYVGGRWNYPLGIASRGFVFKWNGSTWSELGSGMTHHDVWVGGSVNSIALLGGEVYAGGYFTSAGGTPANRIAKWNGTNWSALGSGMNGSVQALTVSGSDIYAGGEFTAPGYKIAKWNGMHWTSVGEGPMNRESLLSPSSGFRAVTSILVSGTDIYTSGGWDLADYADIGFVSKWNGSSWTEILAEPGAFVNLLAQFGTDIYAAGGILGGVVRWNGSSWLPTGFASEGSGISGFVVSGKELFVGGDLTTAGCRVSAYFTRYQLATGDTVRLRR